MMGRLNVEMGNPHEILLKGEEIGDGWILIEMERSEKGIIKMVFQDKKKWNERMKASLIDSFSVDVDE
jgi:hypothetical protein